jgi:surface antigen
MRTAVKCGLILALGLLGRSAWAQAPGDAPETITVPGERPALPELNADLDPIKDQYSGMTGRNIQRDIRPEDRTVAFQELARSLSGPLDQTHNWHGAYDDGTFTPTREYEEAGLLCRDFWEQTDHHGTEGYDTRDTRQSFSFAGPSPVRPGTACREHDGWHFR